MMRYVGKWTLIAAALAALLLAGCATDSILLKPGRVDLPSKEGEVAANAKWSMWVAEVNDLRAGEFVGAKVGKVDQRLHEAPTTVFLEPSPAEYLRKQLGQYLLNNGLEASARDKARILISIDILRFEVGRDSTSALDELTARIDYKATFRDTAGKEIGSVKIPAERKQTTLVGSAEKIGNLVRDTVASTFKALVESDTFYRALGAL